ncbi:hypothetical protein [Flavobacterium psychrotrophum]|uniref:hypothetical protein n=1 Tax=Flavobacterium psychrotrophum TaxID=2294119 RepID=UPI000E317EE8|nr:hypothetical protein [Flavobacterium psychrotrophum]
MKERLFKLYYRLRYFRSIRTAKKMENKLMGAVAKKDMDREVERIILKYRIRQHMEKYLGVKADSDFIPVKGKSRERCRHQVEGKFGKRMAELGIILKPNLMLCNIP